MCEKSLMQMLIEAGYPRDDVRHHESDLYIYANQLTTKVLEDWCRANGWNVELVRQKSCLCDTFVDQITGRRMYDVAFQYIPWWEKRCPNKEVKE